MKLISLGNGAGYLKGGMLGFAGSGKTFTAMEIAIGVRTQFKLKGPLAMFDTEAAAQYVGAKVKKATGKELIGYQSRALTDAVEFLRECEKSGVSIAIVDSVTHLWRELCDSYLKQRNEALSKLGKNPRTRLEFQDWGPIKAKWATFADLYLNLPMHIIICGRAGYEYDYEEREDGSGKDLVKTGIKMKTEGEFGFEPSLLVEMERVQVDAAGKLQDKITHRATVIKDRFGVLDGKSADNPTFEFFKPYIDMLTAGEAVAVDTTKQTDMAIDEIGTAEWQHEKRQRVILCEEIQGLLVQAWPGQSALEKKGKVEALKAVFGTGSWTAVEQMDSAKLKAYLLALPEFIKGYVASHAKKDEVAA